MNYRLLVRVPSIQVASKTDGLRKNEMSFITPVQIATSCFELQTFAEGNGFLSIHASMYQSKVCDPLFAGAHSAFWFSGLVEGHC